jgi:hypothetical protein
MIVSPVVRKPPGAPAIVRPIIKDIERASLQDAQSVSTLRGYAMGGYVNPMYMSKPPMFFAQGGMVSNSGSINEIFTTPQRPVIFPNIPMYKQNYSL